MKNTYTSREACQLLGVDSKTFHRWLEKAAIQLVPGRYDEREKLITREHLELLAAQHERQLGEVPTSREPHPTVKALTNTLGRLDREIALYADQQDEQAQRLETLVSALQALGEQVAQLRQALQELQAHVDALYVARKPMAHRRAVVTHDTAKIEAERVEGASLEEADAEGGGLPAELVSVSSFAIRHGMTSETTWRKAITTGRLPVVIGRWKHGRAWVTQALDAQGRATFVSLFRINAHFHPCDEPGCPCHTS